MPRPARLCRAGATGPCARRAPLPASRGSRCSEPSWFVLSGCVWLNGATLFDLFDYGELSTGSTPHSQKGGSAGDCRRLAGLLGVGLVARLLRNGRGAGAGSAGCLGRDEPSRALLDFGEVVAPCGDGAHVEGGGRGHPSPRVAAGVLLQRGQQPRNRDDLGALLGCLLDDLAPPAGDAVGSGLEAEPFGGEVVAAHVVDNR